MKFVRIILESIVIGIITLALTSVANAQGRPKRPSIITPPTPPPSTSQSTSPR